ncbi:MAG: sigma-70 family RNA polymerase sigma factor [Clostridia bacterium]|nr:sigma-70 family RNA polymerase sigma factor [Clostridia bacterium]
MIDIFLYIEEIYDDTERELIHELYCEYSRKIVAMAVKILQNQMDAEDALGNVFLKIIKYRDRFLNVDKDERVRLIVIYTRSTCFDMLRKRDKLDVSSLSCPSDPEEEFNIQSEIPAKDNVERDFLEREMVNKIQDMIHNFPSPVREIMILRYFYNLSNTEIGEICGVNPSTVRTIIQRNTEKIRNALGGDWK